MREIKFRAWDRPHWWWHYLTLIDLAIGRISQGTLQYENWCEYTGLKDKNDKEIYEGDVIQYKYYHAWRQWWNNLDEKPILDAAFQKQKANPEIKRSQVEYKSGQFCLAYPITLHDVQIGSFVQYGHGHGGDIEDRAWDFEIIGNIYENPELLA
jgi:uncharacterized phage protein (TIGR01671 family)